LVLAPSRPDAAEIVEHKIHVLIIARRHDRGGLFGTAHDATPVTTGPELPPTGRHQKRLMPTGATAEPVHPGPGKGLKHGPTFDMGSG
jgi:hypothetical protein